MKMKINIRLSVVIVAMLSAAVVSAQKPRKLTDTQRQKFEKEFIAKSREIASLQCGFTQTKTSVLVAGNAVSKGNMYYSSPSMLAWEYVAPIKSVLVVNGKQTRLLDNNGKSVGNSQAIKQLGGLIINMINGSNIADGKMFSSEIFDISSETVQIELYPVGKRLKSYYRQINIKIDTKRMVAIEIVMHENSGDCTTIVFDKIELNQKIDDTKFKITNR